MSTQQHYVSIPSNGSASLTRWPVQSHHGRTPSKVRHTPPHLALTMLNPRLAVLSQPLQVAVDIERTIQHDDVILETESDSRTPSLNANGSRKSVEGLDVLKGQ